MSRRGNICILKNIGTENKFEMEMLEIIIFQQYFELILFLKHSSFQKIHFATCKLSSFILNIVYSSSK